MALIRYKDSQGVWHIVASAQGEKGEKGNDGKPFNYRGDYNPDADPLYTKNDVVRFGGGSLVYINDVDSNEPTSSASHWQQIASKGQMGPFPVYANLAALTSADPDHQFVYITKDTGKWYYYDDGWVEGGGFTDTDQTTAITAQLAQTTDELGDFQDATGFSLATIIQQFNLEPIPDPIYVENLWNPSESTTGAISSSSGNINPHDGNRVSFPIPIHGGENYTLSAERAHGIYFYESEEGGYIEGTGWLPSNEVKTIKAPDNANFARLTLSMAAGMNYEEVMFIVNIGNELMTEDDEGSVWDGGFWSEVPSPPLKENSVKTRHLVNESVTEDKLSYVLRQKINEGGGTSGSGGDLGELYVYDESSSYSSGQEKTIADVDNKSEIDLIEFSSVEIKSELLIYYKESNGNEFLYDLITNDGTPAVANTFENMQLHGSAIVDFIEFDDVNNNFKIAIRNLKCANGFKIKVKNNGSTNRNIATRVVSRQYD